MTFPSARRIAASLVLLVFAVGSAAASVCNSNVFVRGSNLPGGSPTRAILAADFTGDGYVDLVSAGGATLEIHLGHGDGSFDAPLSTSASADAAALTAGDFDGDGKLDLAITAAGAIQVFLGNGDGSFQPPTVYAGNSVPNDLVAGDFDGDGILDLAEGGVVYDVHLLFGVGDGTFTSQTLSTSAGTFSLATSDFDGDGRSDLVVVFTYTSSLAVYPGRADRTFGLPFSVGLATLVGESAVGDFNGDGKNDIFLGGSAASVLPGVGDGTFGDALITPVEFPIDTIATGDFDGDGALDVVAEQGTWGILSMLHGRGDGLFDVGHSYQTSGGLAAAELDGDGRLDVIAGDASPEGLLLLFGQGDGRFFGIESVPTLNFPSVAAPGDFTGDGKTDLAVLVGFQSVRLLAGDGEGGFRAISDTPLSGDWLAAADFNGDGALDLVGNDPSGVFTVLLGKGDGTFDTPAVTPFDFSLFQAAPADFNGDGVTDLAVAAWTFPDQAFVAVLLGNGDGTFGEPASRNVRGGRIRLVVEDFDSDGTPDVAVAAGFQGPDVVSVLLGNGDGTLAPPVEFPTGPHPNSVAAGDFDGDENLDLVAANDGAATVSLLTGDGHGAFAPPVLIGIGNPANDVTAADFDGDGHFDIATATDPVSLLLGLGNGEFTPPATYPARGASIFLTAANLNRGTSPDLVVGSFGPALVVLLNSRLSVSPLVHAIGIVSFPATLTAWASGLGSLTYQWRKGGTPLADGGPISGATTATLTIDPISFADAGSYDVVVTDACASITSDSADLSVEFADVPASSPFHDDILAIATVGLTDSCGGGNFCPISPVRRDQMAALLLKVEHGPTYAPPACTGVFADVPCPGPFTDWVEQLATEGITGGCGGGNFCPAASVTRAQMALFLLKTSEGSGYTPPPATGIFGDVPVGSFGADFIVELYTRGITGGCQVTPLLYCPGNAVLRQQMATFLARTFFP